MASMHAASGSDMLVGSSRRRTTGGEGALAGRARTRTPTPAPPPRRADQRPRRALIHTTGPHAPVTTTRNTRGSAHSSTATPGPLLRGAMAGGMTAANGAAPVAERRARAHAHPGVARGSAASAMTAGNCQRAMRRFSRGAAASARRGSGWSEGLCDRARDPCTWVIASLRFQCIAERGHGGVSGRGAAPVPRLGGAGAQVPLPRRARAALQRSLTANHTRPLGPHAHAPGCQSGRIPLPPRQAPCSSGSSGGGAVAAGWVSAGGCRRRRGEAQAGKHQSPWSC